MQNKKSDAKNHQINRLKVLELSEKIRIAKSLLIILETDMSEEHSDEVHLDVVKQVHQLLKSVQTDMEGLL